MSIHLQRCADRLTQRGSWRHDGIADRAVDAGWSFQARFTTGCPLLDAAAAREALRGRWVLVVGDSRARFIYSALLTLLNHSHSPPLGWPTHRVLSGACMAHVLPNSSRSQPGTFGYYAAGCQLRWKGPCWDDSRGRNLRKVCTLDYRWDDAGTRVTFQWHATTRPTPTRMLRRRLQLMVGASGGPPDVVFASTGTWDMLSGRLADASGAPRADAECCCAEVGSTLRVVSEALGIQRPLRRRAQLLPPRGGGGGPLPVLYGFFTCPACDAASERDGCAHWNATAVIQHYTRRTQACVGRRAMPPPAPREQRPVLAPTAAPRTSAPPPPAQALRHGGRTRVRPRSGARAHAPRPTLMQACARDVARRAGWVYLDVQPLTSAFPTGVLGSPCGNQHPFGLLADVQAVALASVVARAGALGALPPRRRDATDRGRLYDEAWPGRATHCSSRAPCPPSALALEELAEQARLAQVARSSRAHPGAAAGYCAPTDGRGSCATGDKGSWSTRGGDIRSLADCIAKCRACARCRYVSLSLALAHRDCSWFHSCNLRRLYPPPGTGPDYTSVAVGRS